ncbi:OmpH family outer membrane protein [Fulvivirgaceae bacterium BMA12]|uniref:OmpH family outer membrane protein n=1 Tax=Agaribacillus aureus TaxID=3051825 RepID=A0ABT8LIS1_9BACT|nr:OmpH family outer membrane protein [Fulvivirgaceae bacterium BMA12]
MKIPFAGFFFIVFLGLSCHVQAQKKDLPKQNKWGYVDTDFILSKMPDYQKAQKEIALLSDSWTEELKIKYLEIDTLYNEFQEEAVLLSLEEKTKRMEEIKAREDSLSAYRKDVFGFEGQFFQKKKEILKTIQDRLFDAIEQVAKEYKLQTVFDKAGDQNIIYVNAIHDYSDYVLEKLGLGDPNDVVR